MRKSNPLGLCLFLPSTLSGDHLPKEMPVFISSSLSKQQHLINIFEIYLGIVQLTMIC